MTLYINIVYVYIHILSEIKDLYNIYIQCHLHDYNYMHVPGSYAVAQVLRARRGAGGGHDGREKGQGECAPSLVCSLVYSLPLSLPTPVPWSRWS